MSQPPQQPPPPIPPQHGYQTAPYVAVPATGPATPGPQPGSPGRRALAWAIDFTLILLLAVGLGYLTYQRMVGPLSSVSAEVSSGAQELVSSGFDIAGVASKTGPAVWGAIASLIIQGFVALVILQFLYQFIAMAWTGRTVGKALADLRVVGVGTDKSKPGAGRSARRAAVTTLTDSGLFSIACCLLVTGWFVLSVLCWLLAVAAFWANALPSLSRRRRSLGDLVATTLVANAGQYKALARGGQAAAARIGEGARGLAQHQRVQQAWESQPAQQLRQAGQGAATRIGDGARGLAHNERVQQAWESQPAQQLRQAGQGAAQKGRQAWDRLRTKAQSPQARSGTANPVTAGDDGQPPPAPPAAPPAAPPPDAADEPR